MHGQFTFKKYLLNKIFLKLINLLLAKYYLIYDSQYPLILILLIKMNFLHQRTQLSFQDITVWYLLF